MIGLAVVLALSLILVPLAADAQPRARIPRLGYLVLAPLLLQCSQCSRSMESLEQGPLLREDRLLRAALCPPCGPLGAGRILGDGAPGATFLKEGVGHG